MSTRLIVQEDHGAVQVFLHREGQVVPEAAGGAVPFEEPLSAQEREDLRWYLEDYLLAPYAVYEERGEAIAGRIPAWGERLFAAVFGPSRPGRDAYLKARETEPCELWISSDSPAFLSLPWELLRDPNRPAPLALELAGLNRTVSAEGAAAVLQPGTRLKVLMVIARPYGRNDVRYRVVARPLLERLAPVAGEVQLDVLRPPTFDALRERLEQAREEGDPYQILHFDGHGAFGAGAAGGGGQPFRFGAPQGFLVFETESGDEDPVPVDCLAPLLTDARVPLLVFNACQSGRVDGGTGPEAAVATRLLVGGAAAVVAMGYTVYAVAAAEFMAAFYEALFAGKTVSQAVVEGRRQLRKENDRPSPKGPLPLEDWLVPVHYARREVSFPQLRRVPSRPGSLSLADALAGLRKTPVLPEGVHVEGDLSPMGGRFFGRDAELQELERAIRTRRVVVVHGVGGTGKTELAKGFARWLQDSEGLDDRSLVFFHSFEPGVASFGLDGVLASVGLRLFGADFARLGPEERRHAILHVIREHRILLIWDNFETVHSLPDPTQATPPLNEAGQEAVRSFLAEVAREARGGVLITSRSREDWLGDAHRLEVGGLDPQDVNEYADALLASLPQARERRQDRAFPSLLEILAGHPLSLRLVLPQLAHVADAQDLVDALRGQKDLPAAFKGGEGRLDSLGACIHYSFQHLPEEYQDRLPALTLFEGAADVDVLAVLSEAEGVPERFAGISREDWVEMLGACAKAGLLTELGTGMYRIHPALPSYLVALWRERAGIGFEVEQDSARTAGVNAHAVLGGWLFNQIRGGDAETAFAVLDTERRSLGAAASNALEHAAYQEAQTILQPLVYFWNSRGLGEEAKGWVDRCREALEDSKGQSPNFETSGGALWLFMVGSQASRLLDAGALDQAEVEYRIILGTLEKSETASSRNSLAVTYHQLGRVEEERGYLVKAEDWYSKSLEIEKVLENQPGMASSYHHLGIVRQGLGDLIGAEDWYRKSLEIEEALGNLLGMASSYHQLGIVRQLLGDLVGAEDWYHKSLGISEALESLPGMVRSYHQLGMVRQLLGDLIGAEDWYRKSLVISEYLRNWPGIAKSYHQLGMVRQDLGDLVGAEDWYRKSLEIKETLGDRPAMANSYHQLGTVRQLLGDLVGAEDWYRKSLEIKEALGDRPAMALGYGQMGVLSGIKGDKASALDWTVRCVTLFPEFPHPMTDPGPTQLALFTSEFGMPALEESWLRSTGSPLPDQVRLWVEAILREAAAQS